MSNSRFGFKTRKGEIRSFIEGEVATSNDIDAQAFIDAANITDPTQKSAINTLVISLKTNSIWDKFSSIYPFVGGTSTSHKFNLKDPQDTDISFRLSFLGGWTHSVNGIQPNGINGYANTFNTPSALNDTHLSIYSRTNSDGLFNDIGNATNTTPNSIIIPKFSNSFFGHINQNANLSVSSTGSTGLFLVSRTASDQITLYKNGALITTSSTVSTSLPNLPLLISAWNQNPTTISRYSNRQLAFTTVGSGLIQSEVLALYNIIQTFQTTLGRQV